MLWTLSPAFAIQPPSGTPPPLLFQHCPSVPPHMKRCHCSLTRSSQGSQHVCPVPSLGSLLPWLRCSPSLSGHPGSQGAPPAWSPNHRKRPCPSLLPSPASATPALVSRTPVPGGSSHGLTPLFQSFSRAPLPLIPPRPPRGECFLALPSPWVLPLLHSSWMTSPIPVVSKNLKSVSLADISPEL